MVIYLLSPTSISPLSNNQLHVKLLIRSRLSPLPAVGQVLPTFHESIAPGRRARLGRDSDQLQLLCGHALEKH